MCLPLGLLYNLAAAAMGQAAQQLSPGRTTLLDAVNIALATIGEQPVNSLETQQVGEAAQAERTLLEFHKEGQVQGWSWNREADVPFHRDPDTGELTVPANIAQWAPSRIEWNGRFQLRGAKVYDLAARSYAIDEATIYANIVTLLSWDESPEVFNRWVTIRAARVFGNRAVGNTTTYQLTQADQDEAWANLLRIDTAQSQPNSLTGGDTWATYRPALGLRGRRGSGLGMGDGALGFGGGRPGAGGSTGGGTGTGTGAVLPQPLGTDASPSFVGLTLSGQAGNAGSLALFGTGGAVAPLPLGSGLSIVNGMLTATGGSGTQGPAGTIQIGTVTTGAAGSSAAVSNAGTPQAAIFDFTIPRGNPGTAGAAATIGIGTITTGAAGSSAAVSNAGTPQAAIFDFTIPRGNPGTAGADGVASASDPLFYNPTTKNISLSSMADGMIFKATNRGETGTASTNYDELPVAVNNGTFAITGIYFGCHIDSVGTGAATFNAYRRTAAGVKTSLLTANATLSAGASLVDATPLLIGATGITAGTRVGFDVLGFGGATGVFVVFLFTRTQV